MTLPLIFAAAGILASIIGMFFVRSSEGQNPTRALNMGTYATTAVFAVLSLGVVLMLDLNMAIFWANVSGLIAGIVIGMTTDYYTSIDQQAVAKTAEASQTGICTPAIPPTPMTATFNVSDILYSLSISRASFIVSN